MSATPGPHAADNAGGRAAHDPARHGLTNALVHAFLHSNLSIVLVLLAAVVGLAALLITPREEDPQIVVPLADVFVSFPGRSAAEVERLVATPLEKLLYQIDGVEYVYSMSRENQAVITVRFYVGEDRERSLVKLYKRIDEHVELVPPGVAGWVVKPVEIDDVPVVTLTLRSAASDEYTLRRVAEEAAERLAAVHNLSRAYVIGGPPRTVRVLPSAERMAAYGVAPLGIRRAIEAANATTPAGGFTRDDEAIRVETGDALRSADELRRIVVGVFDGRPVYLQDVADVVDGPAERSSYVRHGWGPGRGFAPHEGAPGTLIGGAAPTARATGAAASCLGGSGSSPTLDPSASPVGSANRDPSRPAVTIALAKQKGSNAVWVAQDILKAAADLKRDLLPDDVELVVTRNYGLTADEKVNELVEALGVAILIVIGLLTLGLGWRESLIVAVAVPVVFGLTLAVNLLLGYTINRVTLFALILSLGLLVDDPIVDVENISRHFALRRRATRDIVQEAVAEIRPPLITATLAVIVSFLPMFFITGMMGPYMRPMALNVPVTMLMSMLVAFTITPWLSFHVLRRKHGAGHDAGATTGGGAGAAEVHVDETHDPEQVKRTFLYKLFYPVMAPLLHRRRNAWLFLLAMAVLTLLAMAPAAQRRVPLKMLPFDNKNELLLVLDFDEGTTLERTDAGVRAFEDFLRGVPEVTDYTSYVGLASPMDFNGLVRHYYLRQGDHVAEIRLNLVSKKHRRQQSHGLGLRLRDDLTAIAAGCGASLKIVEMPPGPPVISTITAEVYGRPDHRYDELIAAAAVVRNRLAREPGVVDVDDSSETLQKRLTFETDKEKAALSGVTTADIGLTLAAALDGAQIGTLCAPQERQPLAIELRLPRAERSGADDLAQLHVAGTSGALAPLAELGRWRDGRVDQTIYHKNLQRVAYVFAETAGRAPAEAVVDIQADRADGAAANAARGSTRFVNAAGWTQVGGGRASGGRSFLSAGGGLPWALAEGFRVDFAGEGEWKITLDVFRDLGLAFGAALVAIYILLVAQTASFTIPVVVMLAIPLTILGILPGFWLLNAATAAPVAGYADPVFFTATGMIGMIALAGIVTRDSIILVDFIHLSLQRGRTLFEAIMESRVVRLRPILLTAGTAMLSAIPITIDPIFSGLAWSLIFGLFASTVFTLFVIPVSYWLLYEHKPGHGLPDAT